MIDFDVVGLARLQFGLTAPYHFLFVYRAVTDRITLEDARMHGGLY